MSFIAKRAFHIAVQVWVLIFVIGMSPLAADRPPLVGIAHIAFQVSDLVKAQAFYGGLLGYEDASIRKTERRASSISKSTTASTLKSFPACRRIRTTAFLTSRSRP
jgi:hypothetical protein